MDKTFGGKSLSKNAKKLQKQDIFFGFEFPSRPL